MFDIQKTINTYSLTNSMLLFIVWNPASFISPMDSWSPSDDRVLGAHGCSTTSSEQSLLISAFICSQSAGSLAEIT